MLSAEGWALGIAYTKVAHTYTYIYIYIMHTYVIHTGKHYDRAFNKSNIMYYYVAFCF